MSIGWTTFTGIGGVDEGMAIAGINSVLGVEFDPDDPDLSVEFAKVHEQNSRKLTLQTIQGFVVAGCPGLPHRALVGHGSLVCAYYSVAASAEDKEKRAKNNMEMAIAFTEVLKAGEPENFSLEQVPDFAHSEEFRSIVDVAKQMSYNLDIKVVNVGKMSGQNRDRLIITGAKKGLWYIPRDEETPYKSWYQVLQPLLPSLLEVNPSPGQLIALKKELANCHPSDRMVPKLVERVTAGKYPKIRYMAQQCPCLLKSQFREKKKKNSNLIASRNLTHSIWLAGTWLNVDLRAIAALSGFPSSFKYPNIPAISGAGFGYCVPPIWYAHLCKFLP